MPKKVLLIEYEPRYIERTRTLLTPLGYTITEAHDGEAGIQTFGASRFDLILLSGMLPRLPSAEVIREIRKKGGATAPPIILMMTGYRGSNRKADAQKVGAFDILQRPFSDEDFMGSVREAIDATDVGAKTMRIETAQAAAAPSPLTSSDIFSDLLDELTADASKKRMTPSADRAPSPPPAVAPAAPPAARPDAESDMDKRLRDTLSGLMPSKPAPTVRPAAPSDKTPPPIVAPTPTPPATPRPRMSSDTDVDRMISDTLSGLTIKPRPPAGVTPPPASAPAAAAPRRREEPAAAVSSSGPDQFGQYEMLERIATGGMAEVYKAKRTGVEGFQKIVAIKKILPHLADDEDVRHDVRRRGQARGAAEPPQHHPHLRPREDPGRRLLHRDGVRRRPRPEDDPAIGARPRDPASPVPLAVYVASKVAAALDYAHRRTRCEGHELNARPSRRFAAERPHLVRGRHQALRLRHRQGRVEGVADAVGRAEGKAPVHVARAGLGKAHRPPQRSLLARRRALRDAHRANGCSAETPTSTILEQVRSAEVRTPRRAFNPEVPQNLDTVVLKALAKEPDDRYANASDLLRDLDSVLYSYTPAPGSADVAIYLHRLQAEEGAVAEAQAREAAQAVEESEPAARKRKSKGAPVSRKTSSVSKPAPPPPPPAAAPPSPPPASVPPPREPSREVFGSLEKSAEAEKASRTPLIALVVAAAVALVGFLAWRMMKPSAGGKATAASVTPVAALPTSAPTLVAAAVPVPTAAPPAVDQKAVEAEVQRQLAIKRKELERTAAASKAAPAAAEPAPAQAVPAPQVVEPTALPTLPPTAVPIPTAIPTEPPPVEAPKPAPPKEVETQRGDLVGPGPGVVEPTLVAPPRVVYPAIARERRVEGRVVVLVLVDENGLPTETRLQQGVTERAVNDAVLAGVKSAKFRAATKNGIPVKMWRPIIVEVKP